MTDDNKAKTSLPQVVILVATHAIANIGLLNIHVEALNNIYILCI